MVGLMDSNIFKTRNWDYNITEEIIQGKVFDYIKKKFEEMISEIDELQLRMP